MSPTLDLYAKLSSLSLQELINWKLNYTSPSGPKTNELALFIIAVDAKRERTGSLRAFLKEKFGHIDANVYKPRKLRQTEPGHAEIRIELARILADRPEDGSRRLKALAQRIAAVE